jgi:DNA replication initiation complex subunit (GINS family)
MCGDWTSGTNCENAGALGLAVVDSLYESPIPGFKTPLEKTLSPEDQELVEKLMANLTDEEIEVLMALVGSSERNRQILWIAGESMITRRPW